MFLDKIVETVLVGGWVLIPIFLVGAVAIFLLLDTAYTLGGDLFRSSLDEPVAWFKKSLVHPLAPPEKFWFRAGFSYDLLHNLLAIRQAPLPFIRTSLEIDLVRSSRQMGQRLNFVGVLASLAPLLGLLGTVDGMMQTFEIIMRFGNSNPVLLADGISEALLTTQAGLLIAFPIILIKNFFDDRIAFLKSGLERLGVQALAELEMKQ